MDRIGYIDCMHKIRDIKAFFNIRKEVWLKIKGSISVYNLRIVMQEPAYRVPDFRGKILAFREMS